MARVTSVLALLAFLSGAVTFYQGVRVGYGEASVSAHLYWGFATLVLQLFATGVAFVHARAQAPALEPDR